MKTIPKLKLASSVNPKDDYSVAPFTERDKTAPDVKLHNVLDVKFLEKIRGQPKTRDERVTLKDTKTGKIYGIKTIGGIVTEERLRPRSFEKEESISKSDVETAMPEAVMSLIKKNIKKGAADISQNWKNALELTNTAYQATDVDLPHPQDKIVWRQYEENIRFAVRQLAIHRGMSGDWRMTELGLKD